MFLKVNLIWQTVGKNLKEFLQVLWRRLYEVYPENYFSLVLWETSLKVLQFSGQRVVQETKINLAQQNFELLAKLLDQFPDYPVQVIFQSDELQFRLLSLKTAKWWDRPVLLRQAREGEFSHADWKQIQAAPCEVDLNRYLLMGLHPSKTLEILIENLKLVSNPFVGLYLWPVILAESLFKKLEQSQPKVPLCKWVFILHRQNADHWQLIVCQDRGILLTRSGTMPKKNSKIDFAQEIWATLRYLGRKDYQEGQPVSMILNGFDQELGLDQISELQIIKLEPKFDEKHRTLEGLSIGRWFLSFLQKKPHTLIGFQRSELYFHHLAFILPQNILRFSLPLTIGMTLAGFFLWVSNVSLQKEYVFLLQEQMKYVVPEDANQKLETGQLFKIYQDLQPCNPVPILRNFVGSMSPYAVATEIKWTLLSEENLSAVYRFDMNLVLDSGYFSKTSFAKRKIQSLEAYKARIEKTFLKVATPKHLKWQSGREALSLRLLVDYQPKTKKRTLS